MYQQELVLRNKYCSSYPNKSKDIFTNSTLGVSSRQSGGEGLNLAQDSEHWWDLSSKTRGTLENSMLYWLYFSRRNPWLLWSPPHSISADLGRDC